MTEEWASWALIDEQMGLHERIRLLYVASTRACDHLVVSLHRKARKKPPDSPSKRTNAELLVDGMGPLLGEVPDAAASPAGVVAAERRCAGSDPAVRRVGSRARHGSGAPRSRRPSPPPRSPTRGRPIRPTSSPPGCRSVRATSTCPRG